MKHRVIQSATLLVVLLLMTAASCVPEATSTPIPNSAPTPASTAEPNPISAIPPTSTPTPTLPSTSMQRQRTTGTITKISGSTLTLRTGQGPVTVNINSDNITIQNITAGALSDLHEGGYLIAVGSQDVNGNITATSIMIRSQDQGAPPTPPFGATPANPRSPRSGARRGASGTLTKINGNILTLATAQGPVTVNISSDNITIQNITTGTLSDLHEGQSLTVVGPQDMDGNVTANLIFIQS
ncbi:MAG: hypothetical protein ABSG90_03460 [Dehalococcoidia bacterium]